MVFSPGKAFGCEGPNDGLRFSVEGGVGGKYSLYITL